MDIHQVKADFDNDDATRAVAPHAGLSADGTSPTYAWLTEATRSGISDVEHAARTMMAYYQGAEFPSVATSTLDAAWNAYQNHPIDLVEDSDEQYRLCVDAAVRAAFATTCQTVPGHFVTPDEFYALKRFAQTCEDGEGYDVPKEMMNRLAVVGAIRRIVGGRYEFTEFGNWILST